MIVSAPSISVATTVPEIEPLSERTKCSGRIPKVQSAPTTVIFPSTAVSTIPCPSSMKNSFRLPYGINSNV